MNDEEGATLLEQELSPVRAESYGDLVQRIASSVQTVERQGSSGTTYQIEMQVCWEQRPFGNILVMGSIDDGRGWRAFSPLIRSFIKAPDGSFVGE